MGQAPATFEIVRVEANPEKGFRWPYFLGIPSRIATPAHLLVEGNNTGMPTDDQAYTEQSAQSWLRSVMVMPISQLGSPVLIPTFPRPASNYLMYTHALDRDTLLTKIPNLERLDRQLLAMVEDARSRLASRAIVLEKKFFIWGYSASGTFAVRFAFLQPEWVQALSFGGCSAPPVPAASYRGRELRYPNGTADYEQLTGRRFDEVAFRSIPMYAYRGDQDANDEVAYSDGYDEPDRQLIYELFGPGPYPFLRYPKFEMLYQQAGVRTRFYIQPGTGHGYGDMILETVEFFDRNRGTAMPWLRPKPLYPRLHLPVVLTGDGWETVITVQSNSEVSVNGEIRSFAAEGGMSLKTEAFTLAPFRQLSLPASRVVGDPAKPAYLVVASDSGFISASSLFVKGGYEVRSPGSLALRHGVVSSLDTSENGAVVLLNPGTQAANISLWARDASGAEAASARVTLKAGQRITGNAAQVFGRQVPSTAVWLRYRADVPVVVAVFQAQTGMNTLDVTNGAGVYLR